MSLAHRCSSITLAALFACAAHAAPADKPAEVKAPGPGALKVALTLGQEIYEIGRGVRAELVLTNTSPEWVTIPDAADLVSDVRLIPESGKDLAPTRPEQFGAAKTTALGPGGFVGVSFDADMVFPALATEGRYKLVFRRGGLVSPEVALRTIPRFDSTKKYTLKLTTPDGDVEIEISAADAPVAAHNVIGLARTGFYDGASVARLEPHGSLAIHGPLTPAHRITPAEATSAPFLAGTVLLESVGQDRNRANFPDLIVLLAPAPTLQGRYTAIGQVVSGMEVLDKLAKRPTTGKAGTPPFRPTPALAITRAAITEQGPEAPTKR